ncbi:hypothetical protein AMAG_11570 [Allomyces macrogynus ATCC 38327]|uniref:Uncharacterized protein n=1 Tax=Allomyces macrogynus (strain ATCC 38327) TaxID=578462 RepID=A0A0L0SV88_ALLM3|nr:hypothetical protein AMAG_11570 [Allomyces macrogynus ATCC 38327]|eukprot:KNE66432.1 hypothetical protein AMAG_11570 [Allomyces macrogynus ATCC 38327]
MRSADSSRSSSRCSAHSSLRRTNPVLDHRTTSPAAIVVDETDSSISLAASEIPSDTSIVLHNPPKIRSTTRPHPTSAAAILDQFRKPDDSPTPSVSTASRIASPAPASVAVPNEPSKDLVRDFSAFLNHMSDPSGVVQESGRSAMDKSIRDQSRSAVEILSSMCKTQSSAIATSVPVSRRRSGSPSKVSSQRSTGASERGNQSSAVTSAISEEHSCDEMSFGDVTSVIEEEGSDASAISESVVSSIASAASSGATSRGSKVVSDASGSRSAASSRLSSVRSRSSTSSSAVSARSEATRSDVTSEYTVDWFPPLAPDSGTVGCASFGNLAS